MANLDPQNFPELFVEIVQLEREIATSLHFRRIMQYADTPEYSASMLIDVRIKQGPPGSPLNFSVNFPMDASSLPTEKEQHGGGDVDVDPLSSY